MLRHQLSQKRYNVIGASLKRLNTVMVPRLLFGGDQMEILEEECGVMSVVDSINNALSIGVIKTAVNVNLLMNVV